MCNFKINYGILVAYLLPVPLQEKVSLKRAGFLSVSFPVVAPGPTTIAGT